MPHAPPNRNVSALTVLFVLGVIVAVDMLSILSLGTNNTSTFSSVGVRRPGATPAPPPELAPMPRPVE